MTSVRPIWCGLPALLLVATLRAEERDPCERKCHGEVDCELVVLRCLEQAERPRDAIERFKGQRRAQPDDPALARLLTRAYLADGNRFWAQRTVRLALERDPGDCESRSWLVWLAISDGELALSRELLAQPGCPSAAEERARWHLYRAFLLSTEGEAGPARAQLEQATEIGELYREDHALWRRLRSSLLPGRLEPVTLQLELAGGYSSNAQAGAPTDPGTTGPGSVVLRVNNLARLTLPITDRVRPTIEAGVKAHGVEEVTASRQSYAVFSARPGLYLGQHHPRLLLAYGADLLLLNQRERRLFYEGHRAELELETAADLLLFMGAGYRRFREGGRTRFEIDGGVGKTIALRPAELLLAGSLRSYEAVGDAYDLLGATGIIVVRLPLPHGSLARLTASVGVDSYYGSGGARGRIAFGSDDERFDTLMKGSIGLWAPPHGGGRVGIGYNIAWRHSTAHQTDDYRYLEHRLLLTLRWRRVWDPWAPQSGDQAGHVPLVYAAGEGARGEMEQERVQDLLQQDEAARRGSSCVD